MALDRDKRSLPYISGRMIAIAEHYASKRFGRNTLSTLFKHPQYGVDVWRRYIETSDEYYQELKEVNLPITIANKKEEDEAWVGYHHQKAEYENSKKEMTTK